MNNIYCYAWVEDEPSRLTALKIFDFINAGRQTKGKILFRSGSPIVINGNGQLKKKTANILRMALEAHLFSLIITDLDKISCAPKLIKSWFNMSSEQLPDKIIFRVAVREIESWVMADKTAFAKFMNISEANFSEAPDTLDDPKQYLFSVIKKHGNKKWQREMLPTDSSAVGPLYNCKISEFITNKWSVKKAAEKSPSLLRAINSINRRLS